MPGRTAEGSQIPAAGVEASIWRTAMSRNTTEWTSATMARLRLVRIEKRLINPNVAIPAGIML